MYCVYVLTPEHLNVKAIFISPETPVIKVHIDISIDFCEIRFNSTIRVSISYQIIEKVCEKYELDPNEYKLWHDQRILQSDLKYGSCGLLNNGRLRMVKTGDVPDSDAQIM